MSMTKDMWMDEIESICEQYRTDDISLTMALRDLSRMGLSHAEALDLLTSETS